MKEVGVIAQNCVQQHSDLTSPFSFSFVRMPIFFKMRRTCISNICHCAMTAVTCKACSNLCAPNTMRCHLDPNKPSYILFGNQLQFCLTYKIATSN